MVFASLLLEATISNLVLCSLCHAQRLLWFFIILILLFKDKLMLIGLITLLNLVVSLYQLSLQYGFIVDNSLCKINFDDFRIISCADLGFTLFDLPLSMYNFVVSGVYLVLILVNFKYFLERSKSIIK